MGAESVCRVFRCTSDDGQKKFVRIVVGHGHLGKCPSYEYKFLFGGVGDSQPYDKALESPECP